MDDNKKVTPEDKEPMDNNAPEKTSEVKIPAAGRPKVSAARSKRGAYTAAVSALVVAIVIIFNLLVGSLPEGTLEFDNSGKDLYTVTSQSVDYLKGLDKDVSIVVLAQSAVIDKHILKFINNYARLSSHIKLQIIDPVLDPTALTTYNAKENNVVVKCDATNKSKTLNLGGIQGYQDGLMLYDANYYQTYQQLKPVALDAEGQLTSAVSFVTSDKSNSLYELTGHGEGSLGQDAEAAIAKVNIQTPSLNLLTAKSIPTDCQVILCYNPTNDLTGDELNTLENFLKAGGKFMLMIDNPGLKNFNALMAEYGLQMKNGFVGDEDRYYQNIYTFLPLLPPGSDVNTDVNRDVNVLVHNTRGMVQVTPGRRGATVTPFMTTSTSGILADSTKNNADSNAAKSTYILGAVATETFTDKTNVTSRFTVITSLDLAADGLQGLGNMTIFTNAIVKNYTDVQNVSVPSKSLNVTPVTIAHPLIWVVLFVAIIPLAVLAYGLVYWIKRRNR